MEHIERECNSMARTTLELTQDEIDDLVQRPNAWCKADYHNLRALQDGLVDVVTYPDKIVRRKKE